MYEYSDTCVCVRDSTQPEQLISSALVTQLVRPAPQESEDLWHLYNLSMSSTRLGLVVHGSSLALPP